MLLSHRMESSYTASGYSDIRRPGAAQTSIRFYTRKTEPQR
jgi:hypothetical protein